MINITIDKSKASPEELIAFDELKSHQEFISDLQKRGRELNVQLAVTLLTAENISSESVPPVRIEINKQFNKQNFFALTDPSGNVLKVITGLDKIEDDGHENRILSDVWNDIKPSYYYATGTPMPRAGLEAKALGYSVVQVFVSGNVVNLGEASELKEDWSVNDVRN